MGKVCIITGASQGIGRATAIKLSHEPTFDALVLIARREDALRETASAMDASGKTIRLLPYDLSELQGIPELMRGIHDEFGRLDMLLNIAGYAEPKSLLDTSVENVVTTFTVNVFAMLLLIREFVRYGEGRGAKIVNIASTAGMTSRPGWVAYASSKAAVVSLSQTLSDELAGSGIKVYTVSPGRTATDLRRRLAPEEDFSRIMQPDQVAEFICMLARDSEQLLDGQNIVVRQQL